MKFLNLFKKELREMLNVQTIATMVIMLLVLIFAGQAMSDAVSDSTEDSQNLTICDLDNTDFTQAVLTQLETTLSETDGKVTYVDIESDNYSEEMKKADVKNVVIIPKGFTQQVENHETADVKFVQKMTSLATMSNLSTGSDIALELIKAAVKATIYADKITAATMTQDEMLQLENPVNLEETTVVADKSEEISSSIVISLVSAQGVVVPIILFVLIMFSSQMILNAISTEKIDKTLETLLSAPISRLSVITAKMLSAAVVAAMQAIVYMVGMEKMMSSITSGADTSVYDQAIKNLGLTLSPAQYVLVGIQMFLSILIALSVSMVLGALAKDAKSAQTLILPITMAVMIPYMLSMFIDIKTASPILRYIVYAIPFSHSFMASENLMFGNTLMFVAGTVYQAVFLVICMIIALKIFMSDRIFTMSIGGGKKRHKKNAPTED